MRKLDFSPLHFCYIHTVPLLSATLCASVKLLLVSVRLSLSHSLFPSRQPSGCWHPIVVACLKWMASDLVQTVLLDIIFQSLLLDVRGQIAWYDLMLKAPRWEFQDIQGDMLTV